MTVCKTPSRRRVTAGSTVSYRLKVRNTGLVPVRDLQLCDPVPIGMTIVSTQGGRIRGARVCWRLSVLNRTLHRTVTARVNQTASGRLTNTAHARASNAATARNATRIRVLPARGGRGCAAAVAHAAC